MLQKLFTTLDNVDTRCLKKSVQYLVQYLVDVPLLIGKACDAQRRLLPHLMMIKFCH